MNVIKMSPAQWDQVQDNPIQRNTEEHAARAVRDHLRESSQTHNVVHAAALPSGEMYKLDGHTRALLWSRGQLKAPHEVLVIVYSAENIEEVRRLYREFDSVKSVENAGDKVSGAYRLHGIKAQSGLLLHGGVTSALNMIAGQKSDVYESVGKWKNELQMLDSLNFTNSVLPSGLFAAALLTCRKYGDKCLDFWRRFAEGAGTRIDGKSDGIDELSRIVATKRAAKQLAGSPAQRRDMAEKAISCFETWRRGGRYSTSAKPTDLTAYIAELEAIKGEKK
jgi:hypothetical protein